MPYWSNDVESINDRIWQMRSSLRQKWNECSVISTAKYLATLKTVEHLAHPQAYLVLFRRGLIYWTVAE